MHMVQTQAHTSLTGQTELSQSYAYCQSVTRQQAKNFYYGLRLTPEPKRSAMYAIYAWMRAADDLADDPRDAGSPEKKIEIERFRQATHHAVETGQPPTDAPNVHIPMWAAVARTFSDYGVPVKYLDEMVDGQLLDQNKKQYATFEELYGYCYKVASTVGMVCVTVWGYDGRSETRLMAEQRGIALQLTNILRDIIEDAERGRVYLPADELAEYGVTIEQLRRGEADANFDRFMRFQVERAEDYYRKSKSLELYLDPGCRPTSWALMRIYHCLLARISRDPRRVLKGRIRIRKRRKLLIALNAMWSRTWA